MSTTFTLTGRKVVGGCFEGEALVTRDRISGWGGTDPRSGTVIETRHQLTGTPFAAPVLLFPRANASSAWPSHFHIARLARVTPAPTSPTDIPPHIPLPPLSSPPPPPPPPPP